MAAGAGTCVVYVRRPGAAAVMVGALQVRIAIRPGALAPPPAPRPAAHSPGPPRPAQNSMTLRIPSWASISSNPRLTSSRLSRWEMNGSTSSRPSSIIWTS